MALDTRLIGTGAGLPDIDLRDHDRHSILSGGFVRPTANGEIVLPLQMTGLNADDAMAGYQNIAQMLTAAERLADSGSMAWVELLDQPHQSRAVRWGIKGGTIEPTSTYVGMLRFTATLTLRVMDVSPYGARSATQTSATLTNGSASILLSQTAGDDPALPRLILTRQGATVIPGYRIGVRPVPAGSVVAGDIDASWIPLLDLVAAGGTSGAHAGSVGGFRISRTLADMTAWSPIASVVQGAGTLAPGRFHTYTSVTDEPTTPTVTAPTALAGTVTDRAVVSDAPVTTTAWTAAVIRQSDGDSVTGIPDATATQALTAEWPAATLLDSDWFAFVTATRTTDGIDMAFPTAPAGWELIDGAGTADAPGGDPQLHMWVYARTNAPVTSAGAPGGQTWTLNHTAADIGTGTWRAGLIMLEVTGANANPVDVFSIHPEGAAFLSTPVFGLSRSTRYPAELILSAFASTADNANQYSYWQGGFSEVLEAAPLSVASMTAEWDETGTFQAAAVNRVSGAFTAAALSIVGTSVVTVVSSETLDSNIPGKLAAGTVEAVVQWQDEFGNLSAPTAVATDVIAREGGRTDYTWLGSNAAAVFSWGLNGQYRQATVYGNAFTLTDMTQGAAILALPTVGSVTTQPSRFELHVGTSDAQYRSGYTFHNPHGSTAATVYSGTVDFPPTPERMDGTRPEWGITVGASGIGTARVDAIWLQSAERGASSCRIEALDDVAVVTVYELRPDGVIVCWMEAVGGATRYPARAVGNLLIPPGDSILTIEALGTGDGQGLAYTTDLTRTFTVAVSYLPRYRWLAGGG